MPEYKNVCFTSFNTELEWENRDYQQLDKKNHIKYMIIQGEHCKDGKKHIQGFIQFHKKKEMTAIKKILDDKTLHIENMKGTPLQAKTYCTDEYQDKDGNKKDIWFKHIEYGEIDLVVSGTRTDIIGTRNKIKEGETVEEILDTSQDNTEISNIIRYGNSFKKYEEFITRRTIKAKIASQYDNTIWNKIQNKILEIIDGEVNTRQVNWIYDEIGNTGKSYIAKYLQTTRKVYYITGGRQNDILYGYQGEGIVIIDLARTYADNLEHIYTIIENIKNGQYLSTKYETQQRVFEVPHIIVLANFKPDIKKLSLDRWNIIDTIDYEEEPEIITTNPYLKIPIKLKNRGSATSIY